MNYSIDLQISNSRYIAPTSIKANEGDSIHLNYPYGPTDILIVCSTDRTRGICLDCALHSGDRTYASCHEIRAPKGCLCGIIPHDCVFKVPSDIMEDL